MNIGYVEAKKDHAYDCYVHHDVDLILEDDRNMHICTHKPKQLSVYLDREGYKMGSLFGALLFFAYTSILVIFLNWNKFIQSKDDLRVL